MGGLSAFSLASMAVDSAPCPLVGGGGAGGGRALDVLSDTSWAVTLVRDSPPPSDCAELKCAAAPWWIDVSSRMTGRLVSLRKDLDEACAGPGIDRVRSNKLGSSEDPTIEVLKIGCSAAGSLMSCECGQGRKLILHVDDKGTMKANPGML